MRLHLNYWGSMNILGLCYYLVLLQFNWIITQILIYHLLPSFFQRSLILSSPVIYFAELGSIFSQIISLRSHFALHLPQWRAHPVLWPSPGLPGPILLGSVLDLPCSLQEIALVLSGLFLLPIQSSSLNCRMIFDLNPNTLTCDIV